MSHLASTPFARGGAGARFFVECRNRVSPAIDAQCRGYRTSAGERNVNAGGSILSDGKRQPGDSQGANARSGAGIRGYGITKGTIAGSCCYIDVADRRSGGGR